MKKIQVNVVVTGIRARVDRSLGISMSTPELTTQEKVVFMELQNINCKMLLEPLEEQADLVEVKGETQTKTASQRLRACIYILWDQEGRKETFEQFYMTKMEAIIDWIKSKLN